MATVTVRSDFGAQENKICHCFHFFPFYFSRRDRTRCHDLTFFQCWISSQLLHSPLAPSSRGFLSSSSLSAIRVVSSAYLRLLIFLLTILIPTCDSSSPVFHMMYSAYKLNKQDDNRQPWRTPFPNLNQSIVPCLVLTIASWPAYRFLRRQVRCSGIPISLSIFHSLLWFTESRLWHIQ